MGDQKRIFSIDGVASPAGAISKRAFSIPEFCRRYSIGRTHAYEEIAAGRLRAVKAGRRTLITQDVAEAWLATLPSVRTRRPTATPSRSS
jgi:excisionase family DNA binding protein